MEMERGREGIGEGKRGRERERKGEKGRESERKGERERWKGGSEREREENNRKKY